jgi:aminoglycoside phosphotransferase (APT) family kinase protein
VTVFFHSPTADQVRDTLSAHEPSLADREIRPLGEGWDFVTFAVGDKVVRFAKVDSVWTIAGATPVAERLNAEAELLRELAPRVPLQIPQPRVIENGPHGLPFTVYHLITGVPLGELARPAADDFAEMYAAFIKAMQSFPIARLQELGFAVLDGPTTRQRTIEWYETLARRAFPLLACDTRTFCVGQFETYLNHPQNFAFEPCLTHRDLDHRNVLADLRCDGGRSSLRLLLGLLRRLRGHRYW